MKISSLGDRGKKFSRVLVKLRFTLGVILMLFFLVATGKQGTENAFFHYHVLHPCTQYNFTICIGSLRQPPFFGDLRIQHDAIFRENQIESFSI